MSEDEAMTYSLSAFLHIGTRHADFSHAISPDLSLNSSLKLQVNAINDFTDFPLNVIWQHPSSKV